MGRNGFLFISIEMSHVHGYLVAYCLMSYLNNCLGFADKETAPLPAKDCKGSMFGA